MSLLADGDFTQLNKLKQKANRILRDGYDLIYEPYEKRIGLWNEIKENYEQYKDGECGEFSKDIDNALRRDFEWALAIIAFSFHQTNESFPAIKKYSDRELKLVEHLLKYNVFEIWTEQDIFKRINKANKDGTDETLKLLKEYYSNIGAEVDEIIEDYTIKLPIRDYAQVKWKEYKSKMDGAIFRAMREIDWFSDFIIGVDNKIQTIESEMDNLRDYVYVEKRKLRELFQQERNLSLLEIEEMKKELKDRFKQKKEKIIKDIEFEKQIEFQENLNKKMAYIEEDYRDIIEKLNNKINFLKVEKTKIETKYDKSIDLLQRIRDVKKEGTRFVKTENALSYEEWFIERLNKKFDEMNRNGIKIEDNNFKICAIEETFNSNNSNLVRLPKNKQIYVILKEKKLNPFSKKMELMIKGVFLSNTEAYKEMNFDVYPISLDGIIGVINNIKDENNGFDKIVILIASPTGFEDSVIKFVGSDDFFKRYLSKKIALALFDIETGDLYYNEVDEYAKALAPLMSLEFNIEKIERLKKYIENKLFDKGYVTLDEATDEIGDERTAKKVFYELESIGGGTATYLNEVGFVFTK